MQKTKYLDKMNSFTEDSLPSLSEVVLGSLELFMTEGIPKLDLSRFKKPLFLGSGNALASAHIIARTLEGKVNNISFADENSYKNVNIKNIDGAVIFSASGEKHAAIFARYLKKKGVKTLLITCSSNSSAEKVVGSSNTTITSKLREPYTYNTSTYLGWILACTGESPKKIYSYIKEYTQKKIPRSFANYKGFVIITPEKFSLVNSLFDVKFKELFARKVARDVATYEEVKHAVTVVKSKTECAIEFGNEESLFTGKKFKFDLPKSAGPAAMMAIGYFIIGKVQEQHPQYFKESIADYIKQLNNTAFGKKLSVIVE